MFRGIVAVFPTTVRLSSGGSLMVTKQSARWSSSKVHPALVSEGNTNNVVKENNKGDQSSSAKTNEPSWIKTALDKEIFTAQDFKSLQLIAQKPELNGRNAVNLVNTVNRLVNEGKMSVQDFQKMEGRKKIEEVLKKGFFNIGTMSTLTTLKSLLNLGFSPTSDAVTSLENEVLWLLRKANLKQHFQVVNFYSKEEDLEQRHRVLREALDNIQRRWVELTEAHDFVSFFRFLPLFPPKFAEKVEDSLVENVASFTADEMTKVLSAIGMCSRRTLPVLRAIAYHLNKSGEPLSVRASTDVLVALQRLNFRDQVLIERICNDLVTQLTPAVKPSQIGVLLTTIGQLKYRHEGVLEALCEWMVSNWSQVRRQDVVSLLLSLAAVNFLPSNWEPLWSRVSVVLTEELRSSEATRLNGTILLDVAWSLAVLGHLDANIVRAVLNDTFVSSVLEPIQDNPVPGTNASHNMGVKLKLNQLWALACLSKLETQGFTVKMPLAVVDAKGADAANSQSALVQSVMIALANFVPADKYLRQNVQTPLGVRMEGECILNDQCIPLPLAEYERGKKALPAKSARIAVMVLEYKDLCLGQAHSTGPQALREKLLQLSGYRVVKVKHTEFDPKEKAVKKVQFLEQLIKTTALSNLP